MNKDLHSVGEAFKYLLDAVNSPAMLYAAMELMPTPMFIKEVPLVKYDPMPMRFCNLSYQNEYLAPLNKKREDYINDFLMWGDEIGEIYNAHDWRIWLSAEPDTFMEKVKSVNDAYYYNAVVKYPVITKNSGNYLVGFCIQKI
jgi:hypothetical protein